MLSSADFNIFEHNGKLCGEREAGCAGQLQPFLRIPPFPGASLSHFVRSGAGSLDIEAATAALRRLRVGGSYWAAQPPLPEKYVLARSPGALPMAKRLAGATPIVLWLDDRVGQEECSGTLIVTGECDPWHMLAGATALIASKSDELRLVAALLDVPVYELDWASGEARAVALDAGEMLGPELGEREFESPFDGEPMEALETIELCGFWRRLIDSNRGIAGGLGFAFWKQSHVAPLLWGGSSPFRFMRNGLLSPGAAVAVWRSKVSSQAAAELEEAGAEMIEVEDGFLRSRGLGSDCVPPLSITVDRHGPHFDPSRPSELELLLERGQFDQAVVERARALRLRIVESGLAKYGQGTARIERPAGDRRHILVPGQVEDDRAVTTGGCGLSSNQELLRRVREQAPDAFILFKPHPDVVAGHRRGALPERVCLEHADSVVGDLPINSLISMVDEVHVNSSLAGFEALLRGKAVTTYGVPFYAGWGLTRDLGPVPTGRRTKRRTLDELVAAALLLYPRYFDPATGLPCPAEIAVARLSAADARDPGLVVAVRRLQGKFMRRLMSLVQ